MEIQLRVPGSRDGGSPKRRLIWMGVARTETTFPWIFTCGPVLAERKQVDGLCVEDGVTATTQLITWNPNRGGGVPRTQRAITTSMDNYQVFHVLLAMSCSLIPPDCDDKVQVTDRRRHVQGAADSFS